MNSRRLLALLIAAATLTFTAAFAQMAGSAGDFDLSWYTIDCGGGESSGAGFDLHATIGQPDGGDMSGGGFELAGGFWPGTRGTTPQQTCPEDIAPPGGDGMVNVSDLLAIINAWGPCPAPPTSCVADIAPSGGDGSVGVADLLAIISSWGMCP